MNELDDDPWATAAPTASVSQPYQRYSGYIGTFNSNDESGLEYTGASVAAVHEEGDDQGPFFVAWLNCGGSINNTPAGWPQHQQPQEQQPRSMPPVAAQQQQYEEQQQQRQPAHEDEDEDEDEDLTHSRNLVVSTTPCA